MESKWDTERQIYVLDYKGVEFASAAPIELTNAALIAKLVRMPQLDMFKKEQ